MARRPVVLVHGYSGKGEDSAPWRDALHLRGYETRVCSYETLVNEITIRDIAEGFDRALRVEAGLEAGQPFDAIVHSTGMLIVRSWLTTYTERRNRVRHLVGLAPATYGSPLAHKGRSWVGALFRGRKELGPDFLEAGNLVLDGLELGSRFTWTLAEKDLIGDEETYGVTNRTPYAFVFCGNRGYTGLAGLLNQAGGDGTVRWAGCALDSRKFVLDFTRGPLAPREEARTTAAQNPNANIPLHLVEGLNHYSILAEPSSELVEMVDRALKVESAEDYERWLTDARRRTRAARESVDQWQQFVVRAIAERGDPITDYNLQILSGDERRIAPFDTDVHVYAADRSLRCFHVNLTKLKEQNPRRLRVRVVASSGTRYVTYWGHGADVVEPTHSPDDAGRWDAQVDILGLIGDEKLRFFYPFTTTLLELRLDREPQPLTGPPLIMKFDDFSK